MKKFSLLWIFSEHFFTFHPASPFPITHLQKQPTIINFILLKSRATVAHEMRLRQFVRFQVEANNGFDWIPTSHSVAKTKRNPQNQRANLEILEHEAPRKECVTVACDNQKNNN